QRYFQYEQTIFEQINALIQSEKEKTIVIQEALLNEKYIIKKLFPFAKEEQIDWQLVAALSAVVNQFTIITGGPGTGKTTTVAKVLALLFGLFPDLKVALAAPTGKAATRMSESLKNAAESDPFAKMKIGESLSQLEPSTMHRLLGYQRDNIYFKHNRDNPISYDLVIVDESSMLDVALFSKFLEAINPKTKVVLLGDKDQLASVEAGSLFGDLCSAVPPNRFNEDRIAWMNQFMDGANKIKSSSDKDNHHLFSGHVIELKHSHRFSDDEGIGKLSKAIIHSQKEIIQGFFENTDARVLMDTQNDRSIFPNFVAGYKSYIEETDIKSAFKKLNQLRVLCAVREGPDGIYALNREIERLLERKGWIIKNSDFYENRPVIINSNNYELGLFNGDIGIVRKDNNGVLKVWFEESDGSLKSVFPSFIDSAETVFAMTIHKSQGSEFQKVMVVLPEIEELPLLTRELLYTGVTRAREKVILRGKKEVILASVDKKVQRASGIAERINFND
ncbi:MAG TPA: exodeoxyribonuclease V subunit alpha, partial [Chitinophagaceae bacterium]|nr:exodeoxyribonuclease V subunit alpha [Chitinophagaceae bacterium]